MGKARDEFDFTTTEASKINAVEVREKKKRQKNKRDSCSRTKKSSEKYRKQLFLDILQNRSKTSKGAFDENELRLNKKY